MKIFQLKKKKEQENDDNTSLLGNKYLLYKKIKWILENNQINNDTQIKIEKLLIDYSGKLSNLDSKNYNFFDAIGSLNIEFKNILIDSHNNLIDIFNSILIRYENSEGDSNNLSNETDKTENLKKSIEDIKSQKEKAKKLKILIIKTVKPHDILINRLLYLVIFIINNNNIEKRNCVYLNDLLGTKLLDLYYYYEMIEYKKKNNIKDYNITDWKEDNKDFINLIDNTITNILGAMFIEMLIGMDLLKIITTKDLNDNNEITKINIYNPSEKDRKGFRC